MSRSQTCQNNVMKNSRVFKRQWNIPITESELDGTINYRTMSVIPFSESLIQGVSTHNHIKLPGLVVMITHYFLPNKRNNYHRYLGYLLQTATFEKVLS